MTRIGAFEYYSKKSCTVSVSEVNLMRFMITTKFVDLHLKSAASSVTHDVINGLLIWALQLSLWHISKLGVLLKHSIKAHKKQWVNCT